MRVIDLHPEELFDKEEAGALTGAEGARLDAHLERCAVCRFEHQVRADFAREMSDEGEAHFAPHERAALVSTEPKAAPQTPEGVANEERSAPEHPARPRVRLRAREWALAAAAVLAVGAAAAGQVVGHAWIRRVAGGDTSSLEPREAVAAKAPMSAPAPSITRVASPPPEAPAPASDPPVAAAPAPAPRAVEARPLARAHRARSAAKTADAAAALFDEANDARRRGDYARASELHRSLMARFPASREAHVSMATMGRLHLDRGDLVGAVASFDSYAARGSGELEETVMIGRATALDRLGHTDEARRAWRALLTAFPRSAYADHARARVEDSGSAR